MSSKTADPIFLLQKRIEKHYAAKYPDKWIPVYSRVTFSNRSYAEALSIGDNQEEIMRQVMAMPNIEEIWDSKEVEEKITSLLER